MWEASFCSSFEMVLERCVSHQRITDMPSASSILARRGHDNER
jgi:hypothetical protein